MLIRPHLPLRLFTSSGSNARPPRSEERRSRLRRESGRRKSGDGSEKGGESGGLEADDETSDLNSRKGTPHPSEDIWNKPEQATDSPSFGRNAGDEDRLDGVTDVDDPNDGQTESTLREAAKLLEANTKIVGTEDESTLVEESLTKSSNELTMLDGTQATINNEQNSENLSTATIPDTSKVSNRRTGPTAREILASKNRNKENLQRGTKPK